MTIQLDVKSTIAEGLQELVDGERLEGENAYQLESGEKVSAQKRICVGELPATLIIQLKRFHIDFETMQSIKTNSHCAFPMQLDMAPYTKRGLDARAAGRQAMASELYELVGVLVHSGTSNFGHYFSYARAREGSGGWHVFNDTQISTFDETLIEDHCFGGVRQPPGGVAGGTTASGGSAASGVAPGASEKVQNAFLLFYRRVPAPAVARKGHRRSGSAPPAGLRYSSSGMGASSGTLLDGSPASPTATALLPFSTSPQLSPEVGPALSGGPDDCMRLPVALEGRVGSLPDPSNPSSPNSVSPSQSLGMAHTPPSDSSRTVLRLPVAMCGASTAAAAAPAPTAEARAERASVVELVHAANCQLLLRHGLYDPTYIDFLLGLLTLTSGDEALQRGDTAAVHESIPTNATVLSVAVAAGGGASGGADAAVLGALQPPPPPAQQSPRYGPAVAVAASIAIGEAIGAWHVDLPPAASLQFAVAQLCLRFFFSHLLRLHPTLLEPNLSAGRSWLAALEHACDASLPAALWLLHSLLSPITAPPPPRSSEPAASEDNAAEVADASTEGGSIRGGCWLLGALFDCQSSAARTAIVGFVVRLVRRVGAAEAEAAGGAPPLTGHVSAFVRALLQICLPHAATYWGDTLPLCDLIRALVLLPPPLGPQLAEAWLAHDGLHLLASYIIGEAAIQMPAALGEPILPLPRPERGALPPRTTATPTNNEGTVQLIEALATLLDASAGYAAGAAAAASVAGAAATTHAIAATTLAADGAPDGAPASEASGARGLSPITIVASPNDERIDQVHVVSVSGVACDVVVTAEVLSPDDEASFVKAHAVAVTAPLSTDASHVDEAEGKVRAPAAWEGADHSHPLGGGGDEGASSAPGTGADVDREGDGARGQPRDDATGAAPAEWALPLPVDLVCSAGFVSSAVSASVRAGCDSTEALCRLLERGCRGSAERSSAVLAEALRTLRMEGEAAAEMGAQLLLHLLTRLADGLLPLRCSMTLKRPAGLIGLVLELVNASPPERGRSAEASENGAREADGGDRMREGAGAFNESARCYLCMRVLLNLTEEPRIAQWLDDVLVAEEIDVMVRWLRDASRTAALGRAVEKARFLGLARRRGGFERTESQQNTLEQLKGLQKASRGRGRGAPRG